MSAVVVGSQLLPCPALASWFADWVDSSGIRLTVSPTLRPHDGGVMELGLEYTDKMAIPPGQARFDLTGYCISECTEVVSPGWSRQNSELSRPSSSTNKDPLNPVGRRFIGNFIEHTSIDRIVRHRYDHSILV